MYDESNDTGVTLEDQKGEVYEYEAYLDAMDKQECENKCWFAVMEYHNSTCPLYSEADRKYSGMVQSQIDRARGK